MKKNLSLALLLILSMSGFTQTPRVSLLEEFTGETCLPCAYTNPGLNAIITANASKVIAIKWQVPIPTAPTTTWSLYQTNSVDINARSLYYGINFAPQARIDGQHLSAFSSGLTDNAANVSSGLISTAQSIPSPFSISMLREWDATCSSVNLTITIQASMNYTSAGTLNFQTIMVERLVQFSVQPGTNGEYSFEDVAIKSFPSINGYSLTNTWITGQTQTFTLNCPIPSYTRSKSEIALVGFIQDETNNEVLQAERADKVPAPTDALTTLDAKVNATCSSSITPQISIYNNGVNPVTSFTVVPYTDLIPRNVTTWNGNLAVGALTVLTLNSIPTPTANGSHTFSYQVVMSSPYNLSNISSKVGYLVATNYKTTPVAENFSVSTFPPLDWTVVNPNSGPSWNRVGTTGSFANAADFGAVRYYFYNNTAIGDIDELYLPPVNLSGGGIPVLSFDLAKAQRSTENDQLDILVSKDCGATWTSVYSKAGSALATSSAISTVFNAGHAADWRKETINLNAFAKSTVLIKFRVTNDNGNNLYLDNINLSQPNPAGIEDLQSNDDRISFFPNPVDKESTLEIRSDGFGHATIKIMNAAGQLVYTKQTGLEQGTNRFKIDTEAFSSGVYLIMVEGMNQAGCRKMVVTK